MPKTLPNKKPRETVPVRIVAADPSVKDRAGPLTAVVDIPAEALGAGPRGYRVHVVDYDASTGTLYRPAELGKSETWTRPVKGSDLESNPAFHARNVYAIVMRTLARFEYALGRRIKWGFDDGHQLKVAPHAFCDGNAFYSRADEALMFGYFPKVRGQGHVFTCLSHDIIVHETSHALLDGLRERYIDPSSADQAAFHEAFADVVALLSVFSLKDLVMHVVDVSTEVRPKQRNIPRGCLGKASTTYEALRQSTLFAIGRELGGELSPIGRSALRNSVAQLKPSPEHLRDRRSSHDRGEVLVAAVIDALIGVWADRLKPYFVDPRARFVSRERVAEEGAQAADYLLTMVIRALDYCPPVHVEFGTFLSAMVTADLQIRPADPFRFREHLVGSFARYGIAPQGTTAEGGWRPFAGRDQIKVDLVRFDSMQRDRDEMFRFVWENRAGLGLFEQAYSRVISLRPCVRVAPADGFTLRETVAEVLQQVKLKASELKLWGVTKPQGMPNDTEVMLSGGVTLIFDEFGRVRFCLGSSVLNRKDPSVQEAHNERLDSLWIRGAFRKGLGLRRHFGAMHRLRSVSHPLKELEGFA